MKRDWIYIAAIMVLTAFLVWTCNSKPKTDYGPLIAKNDSQTHVIESLKQEIDQLEIRTGLARFFANQAIEDNTRVNDSLKRQIRYQVTVITDLGERYERAKEEHDLDARLILCDSLKDENEILAGISEKQRMTSDSIISAQAAVIADQDTLIAEEIQARITVSNIAEDRGHQIELMIPQMKKLDKKANGAWNRWIKPVAIGTAAGILGFKLGKL